MGQGGKAHTHEPEVTRTYETLWDGDWFVRYGHVKIRFAYSWQRLERWSPEKLQEAVNQAAIKAQILHDAGLRSGTPLPVVKVPGAKAAITEHKKQAAKSLSRIEKELQSD